MTNFLRGNLNFKNGRNPLGLDLFGTYKREKTLILYIYSKFFLFNKFQKCLNLKDLVNFCHELLNFFLKKIFFDQRLFCSSTCLLSYFNSVTMNRGSVKKTAICKKVWTAVGIELVGSSCITCQIGWDCALQHTN